MTPRRVAPTLDPLVPIDAEQLGQALQLRGMSQAQLARDADVSGGLVNQLMNGTTKRCRASVRRRFAKILRIPEAALEATITRGRRRPANVTADGSIARGRQRRQGAPGGIAPTVRDEARRIDALATELGVRNSYQEALPTLLVEPDAWRHLLLAPDPKARDASLVDAPDVPAAASDEERRSFALAVRTSLECIFLPAVTGDRPLAAHTPAVARALRALWDLLASLGRYHQALVHREHLRALPPELRGPAHDEHALSSALEAELVAVERARRVFARRALALSDEATRALLALIPPTARTSRASEREADAALRALAREVLSFSEEAIERALADEGRAQL